MNINDLSINARNAILNTLYASSAAKPATRQDIAAAGQVERSQVGEMLNNLCQQGYLILENENGAWIADSYQEYQEWRDNTLIPAMLVLLQKAQTMGRVAVLRFGQEARVAG